MMFLIFIGLVVFLSVVYLIAAKGLLGESLEDIVGKVIFMAAISFVLTVIWLFTGKSVFIWLIPISLAVTLFYGTAALIFRKIKARLSKQGDGDGWVCRKCLAHNGTMDLECWKCKARLDDQAR